MRIWDTALLRVISAPAIGGGAQYGRLDDAGDRSLGIMYDGKVVVRDTATARTLAAIADPEGSIRRRHQRGRTRRRRCIRRRA